MTLCVLLLYFYVVVWHVRSMFTEDRANDVVSARVAGSHLAEPEGGDGKTLADCKARFVDDKNFAGLGSGFWTIGVDPGNSGALAAIDEYAGKLAILDMPVHVFGATANRREVDAYAVVSWLRKHPSNILYIEDVWGMVHDGGVNGFTFGASLGTILGVAASLRLRVVKVRPSIWKARMGCGADKDLSRARASKLFPSAAAQFKRKKDDGRAEASLIAMYGVFDQGHQPRTVIEFDGKETVSK